MMPLSIKIFFGLCVALICVWALQQYLLFATFPNEGYSLAERMKAMQMKLVWTVVESAVVLSLAWMAAFRRLNWARWGLVGLLIGAEFLPMLGYAMRGELFAYLTHTFIKFGANSAWYAALALKIAAIVLVLRARVEPWFHPTNIVL
jgi:hypothetical protein